MAITTLIIILGFIFLLELIYFKIADKYNIVDKPNSRSSHIRPTIRGGGIIFPIMLLIHFFFTDFNYPFFIIGLLLIGLISFIDDITNVKRRIRITVHLIAVGLLFYQLGIYGLSVYWLIFCFVFVIGTINAVNFMDGINGITGGYGLITILTLLYINQYTNSFTETSYLLILGLSLLVFNIFNFRVKARCFAGDVGSVSLAFIIVFFILQLIIKSNNFSYMLLLLIYGLDVVSTIIFRVIRGENIGEAHRTHFYQFLANEKKIPHWIVSCIYIIAQLIMNIFIVKRDFTSVFAIVEIIFISYITFLVVRFALEGKKRLIGR